MTILGNLLHTSWLTALLKNITTEILLNSTPPADKSTLSPSSHPPMNLFKIFNFTLFESSVFLLSAFEFSLFSMSLARIS